MVSIKKGINYLLHNRAKFCDSIVKNFLFFLPDKIYISLRYRFQMGKWINWKNPKTFTEKIQWLKIYNRKPEYTIMVDKYEVKKYVSEKIGNEYIIPTIGIWDNPEEIDWDMLPNQFVLKTTHGGGGNGVIICKDKTNFNKQKAISKLNDSLKSDIYTNLREWPYKHVKKRVIAEKFISPESSINLDSLDGYKFFCFNGVPKYCQVIRDRCSKETIDFYDMVWNHQEFVGLNPIKYNDCSPIINNGKSPVVCPQNLTNMISICKKLSKNIPFVRVDLYVVNDKEYFGELSFYPASGFGTFTPEIWKEKLGEILKLPTINGGGYKCIIINNKIEISAINLKNKELMDYKFFCFNGKVKFFKVDFGRFVEHHANYYSPDGVLLEFGESGLEPDPNYPITIPSNLIQMIKLAEELSTNQIFLRVDFYNINGKIYFGELTFYPASGMIPWTPISADKLIGNYLKVK